MRRLLALLAALAVALVFVPSAGAVAPVATLTTGPGTYVVNVTADSGTFTISQTTTRDPLTSGGCVNNVVRTRRGHFVSGTTCVSAGTISFSTSLYVACETPLDVDQGGVPVASFVLNAPCPPPAPPAVVVTYGDGMAMFDNSAASVDQTAVFSIGIADTATSCTTDSTDPTFTARITEHFAGIGLNKYRYLTLDGVDYVHVPAGGTEFVAWACT